jgi:sirohydrochlorin cobaltochelatase
MLSAYFLVTHGSRNPLAVDFLEKLVAQSTHLCPNLVGGGLLEGQELELSQQLINFGEIAKSQGYVKILILPVFLLAGVHVAEDIPAQVATAQAYFGYSAQELKLQIAPHLGSYPNISSLLKAKFPEASEFDDAKILLSHGSRRPETTEYLENLAQELSAIPAYWSIAPSVETQIALLMSLGHKKITILPYFLSSSGIVGAINTKISTANYSISIQLLDLPFDEVAIANLLMDYAAICR